MIARSHAPWTILVLVAASACSRPSASPLAALTDARTEPAAGARAAVAPPADDLPSTKRMPVGLNLTGITFLGPAGTFRDVFRQSCWGPTPEGGPDTYHYVFPHAYPAVDSQGVAVPAPTWDADGYLTNGTGKGRYNDQVVFYSLPGLPPGTYNLRADGSGDWRLTGSGNTSIYGTFDGRKATAIALPDGLSTPQLWLTRTEPADHVRNVQMMMPGYGFDDPLTFTDEFIASVKPFSTLRLMDLMATNGDEVGEWADRPTKTSQTFSQDNKRGGVPYECFAELAARTGADLWVNVPRRASDDYASKLGAFLLATLPASTTVYVEYGNELWNSQTFGTALATLAAGKATGFYGDNDYNAQVRYAARRSRQVSTLVQRAFGAQAARVRPVFATQGAVALIYGLDEWANYGVEPGVATRPAAPLATPNAPPYAAAVSAYIGSDCAEASRVDALKAGGVPAVLADLSGRCLAAAPGQWVACRALADKAGCKLLVYEGGIENLAAYRMDDQAFVDLATAANRDPGIGPVATGLLACAAPSFDGFMWFSHMSTPSKYGAYGLVESLYPASKTWPKYRAVKAAALASSPSAGDVPPHAPRAFAPAASTTDPRPALPAPR